MKARNTVLMIIPIALCAVFAIVPIFELIGLIKGLDFVLYSELAIVIVQTLLAVGATVALFILKPRYERTGRIFLMLGAPISLLNALCFANSERGSSIIFALICAGCIFALFLKFVPDSNLKATSAVFSVLITIAIVVVYLIGLVYGAFINKYTVSETFTSIEGNYVAELGTSESLMGTKTVVYVARAEAEFGAVLGSYWQKPVCIYEGEDYEVKTAVISWLDENTVIINDGEYKITEE